MKIWVWLGENAGEYGTANTREEAQALAEAKTGKKLGPWEEDVTCDWPRFVSTADPTIEVYEDEG